MEYYDDKCVKYLIFNAKKIKIYVRHNNNNNNSIRMKQ